jgi:hypothetical protein
MAVTEINCASSTIVVSKGDSTFQQVVDDFPNAERITVVTFNVSPSDRSLLDALSRASGKVCIICNIPKRFERYFGRNVEKTKAAAKEQIAKFMAQLDPTRYGTVVETYFSFRNHAKIVMTDNIAFVGSANFSSESQNNWECGVITDDTTAISQLEKAVEQIKADSVRYLGHSTDQLFAPFATLQSCLDSAHNTLTEDCLDLIASSLDDVERAIAKVDMPWAFAFESGGPLTSRIDMDQIERLQQLVSDSDRLREYAQFDPESVDVDDLPSDAYEEKLEAYLESAVDQNASRLEELEEAAKDDLNTLRSGLALLCRQLEAILNDIARGRSAIDNTEAE